ncbi:hypothetical protein ACWCQP_31040 [Streptomyces chartreusis]
MRESVQGADTELWPEGLADVVPGGFEAAYVQFGDLYPDQQLQLQLLYGASQRAFERRTRVSARVTVVRVLGNALSDPRLGDAKANEHLTEYLDQEIADLRGRLARTARPPSAGASTSAWRWARSPAWRCSSSRCCGASTCSASWA